MLAGRGTTRPGRRHRGGRTCGGIPGGRLPATHGCRRADRARCGTAWRSARGGRAGLAAADPVVAWRYRHAAPGCRLWPAVRRRQHRGQPGAARLRCRDGGGRGPRGRPVLGRRSAARPVGDPGECGQRRAAARTRARRPGRGAGAAAVGCGDRPRSRARRFARRAAGAAAGRCPLRCRGARGAVLPDCRGVRRARPTRCRGTTGAGR